MKNSEIEKCLKDKDRRISKLENKLHSIRMYGFSFLFIVLLVIFVIVFLWCIIHIGEELPGDCMLDDDGFLVADENGYYIFNDLFGAVAFPFLMMLSAIGGATIFFVFGKVLFGDE